jgi:hypothetical protein
MAPNVHNDWAWQPDEKTTSALKRGEARLAERRRAAKDDLITWNLDTPRRRPFTKKELKTKSQTSVDIFLYQYRNDPAEGLLKGRQMSWASLLYYMMSDTYVLGRYPDRTKAEKAIKQFKGKLQYDSFMIVDSNDPDIRFMGNAEINAIMLQCGDQRLGMKREQRLVAALHYISIYDKSRHRADGALLKPYKPAPVEGWTNMKVSETNTTEAGSAEGTVEVAVPTAKAKKKAAAEKKAAKKTVKKVAKKASKGKAAKKSAGAKKERTPREGSKGAVIRRLINEGKTYEQGLPALKKECTDTDKVTKGYWMWYAYDAEKKGTLTPAGKKMLTENRRAKK